MAVLSNVIFLHTFSPCYVTSFPLYTHKALNSINFIINYNIVLYSDFPHIKLLSNLYMHLYILKYINCIIKCFNVLYSYFPYDILLHNFCMHVQNLKYICVCILYTSRGFEIYMCMYVHMYACRYMFVYKYIYI